MLNVGGHLTFAGGVDFWAQCWQLNLTKLKKFIRKSPSLKTGKIVQIRLPLGPVAGHLRTRFTHRKHWGGGILP